MTNVPFAQWDKARVILRVPYESPYGGDYRYEPEERNVEITLMDFIHLIAQRLQVQAFDRS